MPTLIAGPVQAVNDLADQLSRQIQAGQAARATLGARDVAFAWTTGAPPVVAASVNRVVTEGLSFQAVLVGMSATPPAKVAEGAAKPTAIALTSKTVALAKYAGIGTFSTEDFIGTEALAAGVYATLISGALLAFNADTVDAIEAAAVDGGSAATWSAAILGGIAAVAANGGRADRLLLNPSDYAGAVDPSPGYMMDPTTSVPVLFGLEILTSPAVTAGTGIVFASAAVTCAESASSPVCVVDPYSGLGTNEIRLAAEIFAATVVNAPGNVVKVTKTA